MEELFSKICEFLGSPGKMGVTSVSSTAFGSMLAVINVHFCSLDKVNIVFQQTAWIIGIVAGVIAIINGIDKLISNHRKKKDNL